MWIKSSLENGVLEAANVLVTFVLVSSMETNFYQKFQQGKNSYISGALNAEEAQTVQTEDVAGGVFCSVPKDVWTNFVENGAGSGAEDVEEAVEDVAGFVADKKITFLCKVKSRKFLRL